MKSVIREVGSLWHARSHKYIDKIWQNGHWVYIYNDPNQSSGTSQPVQTSGKKKGKKKAKATKDTTKADQKLRSIVTKLGDKTIDRAEYVRKDKDGRRFMWVRNNEGRLVKKYMDDGKAKHSDQNSDELYHHGIKGQKWGIRRYQNEDGSLTDAGKTRYGMQRVLNYNSRKQSRAVAKNTGLKSRSMHLNERLDRARFYNNEKKVDRLLKKLNSVNARMAKHSEAYRKGEDSIKSILQKLPSDYLYQTKPWMYANPSLRLREGHYNYATGTRYELAKNNEKRSRSYKWTKRHSKYPITPIRYVHTTSYH